MTKATEGDAVEALYERLADVIDKAGPEKEAVILSKLVLLLAQELEDSARVQELIVEAVKDLDP